MPWLLLVLGCRNIESNEHSIVLTPAENILIDTASTEFSIITDWSEIGLSFQLINPTENFYTLGITEYGPGARYDPWTGEDCLNGYTTDDTTYLFCHPISNPETFFYEISDPLTLDPSYETAHNYLFQEVLTYILWENTSGTCWVWGNFPQYYRSENCTLIAI